MRSDLRPLSERRSISYAQCAQRNVLVREGVRLIGTVEPTPDSARFRTDSAGASAHPASAAAEGGRVRLRGSARDASSFGPTWHLCCSREPAFSAAQFTGGQNTSIFVQSRNLARHPGWQNRYVEPAPDS